MKPLVLYLFLIAGADISSQRSLTIEFNRGDITLGIPISIIDDEECEKYPNEIFFSSIALIGQFSFTTVVVPRATVVIDDTAQPECSK